MKHNKIFLSHDCYSKQLAFIKGIKFTPREIDVIACLLHARGTKKIASLLSIAPAGVFAHIHNIMQKTQLNSRDQIIDFIEGSGTMPLFRNYYFDLLITAVFKKNLKAISGLNKGVKPTCLIVHHLEESDKSLPSFLAAHLKYAGIGSSVKCQRKNPSISQIFRDAGKENFTVYILSRGLEEYYTKDEEAFSDSQEKSPQLKNIIFILPESENHHNLPGKLPGFDFIYCEEQKYHFSVFEVLKRIYPGSAIEQIISEFKRQYGDIQNTIKPVSDYSQSDPKEIESGIPKNIFCSKTGFLAGKWKYLSRMVLLLVGIVGVGLATLLSIKEEEKIEKRIQSDLIISPESALLLRPGLIKQIDEKIEKNKDDIQILAITGMGGTGKTTLARQWAYQQKSPVVWEINAETQESISESFKNLAYTIARTQEDNKILKSINEIEDGKIREKRILLFLKAKLKERKKWLFIFDNVDSFSDIQEYFPRDPKIWGSGKIIITTRDGNIQNNNRINHALHIGELSLREREELFAIIMFGLRKTKISAQQREQLKSFLSHIPPFPLDVSLAAHYIKTTGIPYEQYLDHLRGNNKEFTILQKEILQDISEYTRTRYEIISLSVKKLIEVHKDFAGLLLFICLLDSQGIPKALLSKYKSPLIVDNFIYNLKKYSLAILNARKDTLSLHRSSQEISLACLSSALSFQSDVSLMRQIANVLEKYIDEAIEREDYSRMNDTIIHTIQFLSYHGFLPEASIKSLKWRLGVLHFYLGDYLKARDLLEENISTKVTDAKITFPVSVYLGIVYRELGLYDKAINLLEEGLLLYKKYSLNDPQNLSLALQNLGMVYREKGNYEKAKSSLEESLDVYKSENLQHPNRLARILGYLAVIYTLLGDYKKSQNLLNESLLIFKESHQNQAGVAWASSNLGNLYRNLGEYKKAQDCFEESLKIYREIFSEDYHRSVWCLAHLGMVLREQESYSEAKKIFLNIFQMYESKFGKDHPKIAWISLQLGRTYRMEGNLQEAEKILKKSLPIYQKNYGENNTETAQFLCELGLVNLEANDLKNAEQLIKNSLKVYSEKKHPQEFRCLEILADIYRQNSLEALRQGNVEQSVMFREQSSVFLQQALNTAKKNLPLDSPFIAIIQKKIALYNSS